ncbi:MAG TPA: PASTA domain-containing protein, partial [Streptosporangiaceae bacterium]|nr:PASTA domain-containing protein [Streptosporangiaceae bacterium]
WMTELQIFSELFRDGLREGTLGYDKVEGLPDVHATSRATCKQGFWYLWAQTLAVPPPGAFPSEATIYYPANASLHPTFIRESQCVSVLVSMSDSDARAEVSKLGLDLGLVTMQPSNNVPFGHVIAANLQSDNQTVDLVESEGTDTVPDLRGDEQAYALSELDEDGLVFGAESQRDDCAFLVPGIVESQSPSAGTYFDPSNPPTVNFTISTCDNEAT